MKKGPSPPQDQLDWVVLDLAIEFVGEQDHVLAFTRQKLLVGIARLLFWAHISADVPTDRGYPPGPIRKGGLTDRWLSDYPTCMRTCRRTPETTRCRAILISRRECIPRHRTKLIFGSDCRCKDGNRAGISQNNNPEAAGLAGKRVARETLTVQKKLA